MSDAGESRRSRDERYDIEIYPNVVIYYGAANWFSSIIG